MQHTIGDGLLKETRWAIDQVRRSIHWRPEGGPPDPQASPDDVVVMTPSGGIPARSGLTVTFVQCNIYGCDGDPSSGSATLSAKLNPDGSPAKYWVGNLSNAAVAGNAIVVSCRLRSGHRYVVLESCHAEPNS